jgi:hypothetical protein
MSFRAVSLVGALVLALASFGVAGATYPSDLPPSAITPQPSSTPAPPPPRKPAPAPSAAAPATSGSPTPAPPQYTTLDGVWEIEFQTRNRTTYAHWTLRQNGQSGSNVTGVWNRGGKPPKNVPLTGTFDGRLFKFTATDGDKQYTFSGYVENYTDIVGMETDGKTETAFTAEHRKKAKALENINPGGIPGITP